jgi:hypothetical protein
VHPATRSRRVCFEAPPRASTGLPVDALEYGTEPAKELDRWSNGLSHFYSQISMSMVQMSNYNGRARPIWIIRSLLLLSAVPMLTSCASVSAVVADSVPTWLGGMPKDVPPRPGTLEYDAWMKQRAEDAAAIKPAKGSGTGQQAE